MLMWIRWWNRYPGARFDSESVTYAFSFSKDLLDHWDWKEQFSAAPDTLKYLQHVADRFDLRRDVQFSTRVTAAHWEETTRTWAVATDKDEFIRSAYLVAASGPLSVPIMPKYEGISSFKGPSFHTAQWPEEGPWTFEGLRVAVLGTGATGIQTIQEVAKTAKSLTVFQRRPNWTAPLGNKPITKEDMDEVKRNYPAINKRCTETVAYFIHNPQPEATFDVSAEEREATFEQLYNAPGFGIYMGYADSGRNKKANDEITRFATKKIRQRVKDPKIAEKLTPKDHGFGTRRLPLDTKYLEVYNQSNVRLVDLTETPIERVTEVGIKTSAEEHEFDLIVYATGFDAITGSYDAIDFQGENGLKLKEHWSRGPQTLVGTMVNHFPNFFMIVGPHTALGNIPRCVEYNVEFISNILKYARDNGKTKVSASDEEVKKWTDHVLAVGKASLWSQVDSWMTGVNTNLEGKNERYIARYGGTAQMFQSACDEIVKDDYSGLVMS